MQYYNHKENITLNTNSFNYNSLYNYYKIPKSNYISNNALQNKSNYQINQINAYNYYDHPKFVNAHQNTQTYEIKYYSPVNSTKYIYSQNYKIKNNQDINIIKMKMGIDLLTQKLNMINDRVKMANDSNKSDFINKKISKNDSNSMYFRDKIKKNKVNRVLNNNYVENKIKVKKNVSSLSHKNVMNYPAYDNNMQYYYSNQNLKNFLSKNQNQNKTHNFIHNQYNTNSNPNPNINTNNFYNNYDSLNSGNIKNFNMNNNDSFNKCKFRSYSNINHFINNNMNNMDNKYYKYSNSINDIHNPRRVIKKIKQKNNYNYFGLTKKKDNKELFIRNNSEKDNKKAEYFVNQRLNYFINKDKDNPNRNNNNDSFLEKEYGSFDNYFIDNQSYKGKEFHNLDNIDVIYCLSVTIPLPLLSLLPVVIDKRVFVISVDYGSVQTEFRENDVASVVGEFN